MKKLAFFILHSSFFIAPLAPLAAAEGDLASALENVRRDCGGIEAEFNKIKTMAGVNAAVAGVGAMAGGGAVAAGFAKMSKDDEAEVLVRLEKLRDIPEPEDQGSPAEEFAAGVANYLSSANEELRNGGDEVEKLKAESKMLGNWRTGLMFGNTATNIAGAAIAEGNKFDENLVRKIENCKKSTAALDEAALQARVDGEDPTLAEKIVRECHRYNYVDLQKINGLANSAKVSAIVGAIAGGVGAAASVAANGKATREGEGGDKGKNLNAASTVLAAGATGASVFAAGFNASQVSAMMRATEIAKGCEGALAQ